MTTISQRLFAPDGARQPEPLTLLSHGGGQQSFAMVLLAIHDDSFRRQYAPGRLVVACAATGNEHPDTDRHVREVAALCAANGVEYHHLVAESGFHTDTWASLEHFYRSGNRIGSKSFPKTCTWNLKIAVQYRFLNSLISSDYSLPEKKKRALYDYVALSGSKISALIGFSAEEADRRIDPDEKVPKWLSANVERRYPLADLGMTRADCQDLIRSLGHAIPFPSLCLYCPYKSRFDVAYMARFFPVKLARWAVLERRKLREHRVRSPNLPPDKNHGVFGQSTNLPDVARRAVAEHAHMSDHEMHARRMAGHGVASRH